MGKFNQRVALVTGASTGVGFTIAQKLYSLGAITVITGRNEVALQQAAREIDPTGQRVYAIKMNVANAQDFKTTVEKIEQQYGVLHYLVNNAGITGPHGVNIEDYPLEAWHEVIETDITGTFHGMKYSIPAILRSGGGAIVNLSACNGVTGIAGIAPYTAAKHAVLGLTRSAALENAQKGIRINAVGPGYIETPNISALPQETQQWMASTHPMGRMATRLEIANVVAFLLSEESSFITGAFIPIDGGYTAQ
ncbi:MULTISPECIES: SDR family NAD(P)-dependent oxidoreductase [Providencia]|uniref:NAD(P)-dependent oxidoreductase n=1 Tax=Providencia rettgeri TaxID=587 RepID=A0A264VSY5_PRORE|nr:MULTISPECIES: SDR family NAD(P)-dependent oxidoreductase [Providencia]EFE51657.1 oxidoreductase, short chain dehydrogenase/reductase family protein [Providencia rettgeri DSM 1131]MBI6189571.1 SDR family oxidoreductase [Providencia rettgeri]MBW3105619.1 SDR family oxidoreductase [Providencia rettgeri]MCG9527907.1 SDR family oxidoreductase [Providencia rettgeri]OZS74476.1 NAD(P)-dependent oxidoreductase [Providencia rettgeri]